MGDSSDCSTTWANYEAIQADVFDHLFAVVGEFDLRVFQYPTSNNVESIAAISQAES